MITTLIAIGAGVLAVGASATLVWFIVPKDDGKGEYRKKGSSRSTEEIIRINRMNQ